MANDITLKVGVNSDDAKEGFEEVVKEASAAAEKAQSSFSDAFKGGFIGASARDAFETIKTGLIDVANYAYDVGADYQKALQSVSAVTGVTGQGLDDLGTRAQDLALKFGGSATTQLEAFQTVLSKFGPDLAKTPEALGSVAESVNVLGKAAGLDAKQSVDALSNAMLQFGVDASDPAKLAQESGRFINVLAASAKVGAAEIPQVSEAILQAGVAAKGAGLSFEETNAAIQGLAVGGKVGSEAGVALRNVIGKLIDGGKEQEAILAKVGLSYQDLGNKLTTAKEDGGGLAAALELLKGGLDKITNPAEKAAAAGKLFGAENSAAAGILLDQVDNIKLFTEGVTGTSEAVTQAAINQDTLAARFDKVKAAIEVGLIKAFQALTPVVKFVFDNFATIATYLSPIAIGLAAVGTAALLSSPGFAAFSAGVGAATTATIEWTVALLANPVFLIAAGVAAAAVGIVALADALSTSTEEQLANNEAQAEGIKAQIDLNQEQQKGEIQTQKLVNEFKELAGKSKLSAEEQNKLQDIQRKLQEKYPNLIDATKSYKENLKGVDEVGKATTSSLGRLRDEGNRLQEEFRKASREILKDKRELALSTLFSSTTGFLGGATDLTNKVEEFKQSIYKATQTSQIQAAQERLLRIATQVKQAGGFGSGDDAAKKYNEFVAGIGNAASTAAQYLDFYKKKAETPVTSKTTVVVDDKDATDKETKRREQRKKDQNKQVEDVLVVIDLEKQKQEAMEKAAKDRAIELGQGEISKEQKKELLEQEKERLTLLLNTDKKQVEYFDKQYKSLNELGAIKKDQEGKIISGITGDIKDKEKVIKAYNDIEKKLLDVSLALNKIQAADTLEGVKEQFEDLKKTSESLRKEVPEKLSVKFAFQVGVEEYEKGIADLQGKFATAQSDINNLLLSADEKQKEELLKQLEENKKAEERLTREYGAIIERVQIEGDTDAAKRRLNLSLLDLRLKFEKDQEENAGNFTKLEELETAYLLERAKLNDEYNRQTNIVFGIQSAVMGNLMAQFNIGRLIEEREANKALRDEKKAALDEEESDLEESLANRTITFQEYQERLAEINQARIDAGLEQEKLGDQLLKDLKIGSEKAFAQILTDQGNKLNTQAQDRINKQAVLDAKAADAAKKLEDLKGKATLEEFAKAQKDYDKAQKDAADNDEMIYGFRTSVLEDFAGKAAIQFAQLAASGKANLADFGKVTVQLAFEALQKMIPIYIANIAGKEFATGIGGIATTAILTAALYALFAAAQSSAGFKDGVVALEGEGTETSDSIPAWLSRGESVITARATKQNKDELEWMNKTGLPLREFYRHQISQTAVNESGELIQEIRALRKTTEGLGMQITRNTHVKVDGILQADGNSLTAMIESERKRNSRRF
jgi:TP901 family phage tail tape measure protein